VADFESSILQKHSPNTGALSLTDVSATTKLLVRSDGEQFGVLFGSTTAVDEALVCGTRPGEWYILGTPHTCAAAVARADTSAFTNIIDHTHSRAMVRLSGVSATSVLEKVCNIDWSDTMTPNGAVVSASVAKVTCDIIRDDESDTPSFLLSFDRSYGQYVFDALLDACQEFAASST